MSVLVQVKSIRKRYGDTQIFDGATAVFARGDKIGVIGRNGAGKTTLCRLLEGGEEVDGGEIARSPRLRLGYLEQGDPFELEETVMSFLARRSGKEEWKCGKMAGCFQLKGALLDQPIGGLPGGYRTRVKLAAMLLDEPNFLLLDEPTNYLDLRTVILLEKLLQEFSGGFLLVSHDRAFLMRTCKKTLDVEDGRLFLFPGDVESYLAFKDEQKEQAVRHNKNVEAKRKHLQEFVDRYRVRASTASRAQSKLKEMERLETIEIDHPARRVRMRLPDVEEKKGVALRVTDLDIGYPEHVVARNIRLEIERGARVAVVGDNGEGKTTFLRTLAGSLPPLGGEISWGHALETSYYAQHVYADLDPSRTVLECLEDEAAVGVTRQEVLDVAGSFLFGGHAVERPVSVLSGGERARVALAAILLRRRPVLILDEPTNHLDFETVEALAAALASYRGTIFFVSHDRTFVSRIATSVIEIRAGSATLYPGDYDSYVYRIEKEVSVASGSAPETSGESREARRSRREERKERRDRERELRNRVRRVEESIAGLERERDAIERHYLENPTDYSREKRERLEEVREELRQEEARWLELQEEVEGLES